MIFGFNTDIRHNGIVFHVQSEAREAEQLLQTQVFVKGRCVGKRATPYPESGSSTGLADQHKEQVLRDQHRLVLDGVREGNLESVLDKRDTTESLSAIKQLELHWLNYNSVFTDDAARLRLQIRDGGIAVGGAQVVVRFDRNDSAPLYEQATTGADGLAEIRIDAAESSLPSASVLLQALHSGRTATRKFRLRKVEA
jgi:hypothetical protein